MPCLIHVAKKKSKEDEEKRAKNLAIKFMELLQVASIRILLTDRYIFENVNNIFNDFEISPDLCEDDLRYKFAEIKMFFERITKPSFFCFKPKYGLDDSSEAFIFLYKLYLIEDINKDTYISLKVCIDTLPDIAEDKEHSVLPKGRSI